MSASLPGIIPSYNSLTDKHLVGYFSNARIRRHLQRSGLITSSGRIISDKEYRLNALKQDHQRYVEECLAQAIFQKVLDVEHHHQLEMKRKLEISVRKEKAQRVKAEKSRRLVKGAKEPSFSKMTSWQPNTSPGNTQHPLHLPPLGSCAAVGSVPKASSSKQKPQAPEHDQQSASGREKSGIRLLNSAEGETGGSPYKLPVISNYTVPVPPPFPPNGDKNTTRNAMMGGRRFRPITAPNVTGQLSTKSSGGFTRPSLCSNALVTMVFLGKNIRSARVDTDYRDDIKVYQQHCGGENVCVYKGMLLEGETFQFVSKRHHGFPFSLTFFINGIPVDRLSCCCEYKHQKRTRLGGKRGYFGFVNVEGASPCIRCIIAMHLDKKPSPPEIKIENHQEEQGEKSGIRLMNSAED